MPLRDVIARVADWHGITESELLQSNEHHIIHVRGELMWILRRRQFSYPKIGQIMNRHHTTIIKALRKFEEDPQRVTSARYTEKFSSYPDEDQL